jgi:sulfatase maturation enzyme AslB (radical SAM superfamily)
MINKKIDVASAYPFLHVISNMFVCNADCHFCYLHEHDRRTGIFDEEKQNQLLFTVEEWLKRQTADIFMLLIMGGEITLNPYILPKLQEWFERYPGLHLELTTNLATTKMEWLEFFCDDRITLKVSLNESNAADYKKTMGVDYFDLVLKNLKFLKLHRREPLLVSTVLTREHLIQDKTVAFFEFVAEVLGDTRVIVLPETSWFGEIDSFTQEEKKHALKLLETAKRFYPEGYKPFKDQMYTKIASGPKKSLVLKECPWKNNVQISDLLEVKPCCWFDKVIGNVETIEQFNKALKYKEKLNENIKRGRVLDFCLRTCGIVKDD